MNKKESLNCPQCKSNIEVIPIKYGLPYNEEFDYVQKKKLMLGGFKYDEKSPNYYCKSCKLKFKNK